MSSQRLKYGAYNHLSDEARYALKQPLQIIVQLEIYGNWA